MDMDLASRIILVSSTLEKGRGFVEQLKSLSTTNVSSSTSTSPSPTTTSSQLSPTTPQTIPWTITNRYYTADVHFYLTTLADLTHSKTPIPSVPAIVYVFQEGEEGTYKKEVEELARVLKLDEGGGEVVLGVRIGSGVEQKETGKRPAEDEEEDEENANIDSTLMALGFEYVDATRRVEVDALGKRSLGDDEGDSISSLPRVLDALSTIMWPSMRSSNPKGKDSIQSSRSLDLNGSFDMDEDVGIEVDEERDAIMKDLLESTAGVSLAGTVRIEEKGDVQEEEDKELMEQMKALVKDAERKNQPLKPWITTSGATSRDGITMSPMSVIGEGDEDLLTPFGTGTGEKSLKNKVSLRFDDDFTAFVEAPPTTATNKKKPSFINFGDANNKIQWDSNKTPTIPASGYATAGGLTPEAEREPPYSRYRSLGSVSDFGDFTGDGDDHVGDHGGGVPAEGLYEALGDAMDSEDEDLPSKEEVKDAAKKIYGSGGEFDLERTFGMLKQMKGEIGSIEDDEERRRSAARVALGVVYGL